jgi:hypothetical protein
VSVLCLQNRACLAFWQTFHGKVANLSGNVHFEAVLLCNVPKAMCVFLLLDNYPLGDQPLKHLPQCLARSSTDIMRLCLLDHVSFLDPLAGV